MVTSYYDSAADITITHKRALQELKSHGITADDEINEFYLELGNKETYNAQDVLEWLGY